MKPLIPIETFLAEAGSELRARPAERAESVGLAAALGRVLAEPITAPASIPGFRAAAMDGYAVASTDNVFHQAGPWVLPLGGTAAAGHPLAQPLAPNTCVRILTGACLPDRADAILLQEEVERIGAAIRFDCAPEPGRWIRPPDNDAAAGQTLLAAGARLTPARIGLAAAAGLTGLTVRPAVRVSVFSTGDELVPPGAPLGAGQIHDSNGPAIAAAAVAAGAQVQRLGRLPDAANALAEALASAATDSDFVISTGGVSVGDADLIVDTVARLGEISHWRLAIKPGKPFAYGRIGTARFCGLPGNPASALVTFQVLVVPLMMAWLGAGEALPPETLARLTHAVQPNASRVEFLRAQVIRADAGPLVAATGNQDSGRLSSFATANCLMRIDAGTTRLEPGTLVPVRPLTLG